MRRTRRNKKQIIIGIISSIVLVLTIGYSFLSLNLRVLGLAHIGAVWNIHFDNITINPDSVILSSGDIEPEIDEDNDCKINYKVTLTPGDFYEFTFDVVNSGTIDGMIQNMITRIEEDATATLPSYIDYTVSYSDDVVLETNQQLLAGTTETLKVKVEFKDEENVPQSETLDLSYENNYIKKTNSSTVVKHPIPLYNVLEDEYNSNSGLALKYTGQHHDSFTEEPSKNIYHWYADTTTAGDQKANQILEKNNVIFADHCWQMIRTTDTGGVKLIYNGEVENNQCLDTRGTHVGYNGVSTKTLNNNYWYGTDYTYDSTNQLFSIAGTTEQTIWSDSTYTGLIGKYTCLGTNNNDTCSTIYLINSYSSSTQASTLAISSNSHYSEFGRVSFNVGNNSVSYNGYMYGDIYSTNSSLSGKYSQTFSKVQNVCDNRKIDSSYWYADSIDYGNISANQYTLINPYKISGSADYANLVGKYTLLSSFSTSSINAYYISGVYLDGSRNYAIELSNGELLSDKTIVIGDSIVDHENGTYTIQNYDIESISTWYDDYSMVYGKYICPGNNPTCNNPQYVIYSNAQRYEYIDLTERILIGKAREGLVLSDTILLRKDIYALNFNSYSDYKYTCNDSSNVCTEDNLRLIIGSYVYESKIDGYQYTPNRYWGASVSWDGENYTLNDTVGIEYNNDQSTLSTHHYFCTDYGKKICSTVAYLYSYSEYGTLRCILLNDGILSVRQALTNMRNNVNDSLIKFSVDHWFKRNLLSYSSYIEDTIYCNDRFVSSSGGWKDDGGRTDSYLSYFNGYVSSTLICNNTTDQFSINNSSAPLVYSVGLITAPELKLLNNSYIRRTGSDYWTISPNSFDSANGYGAQNRYVSLSIFQSGNLVTIKTSEKSGVRPVISLKPGIKYSDGDGSKEHPYIIKTN